MIIFENQISHVYNECQFGIQFLKDLVNNIV